MLLESFFLAIEETQGEKQKQRNLDQSLLEIGFQKPNVSNTERPINWILGKQSPDAKILCEEQNICPKEEQGKQKEEKSKDFHIELR